MMKFLAYLVCYCIYPFSFLFPRRKRRWAFGSFRGAFNDNAKYLFIHVSQRQLAVDAAWLSINKATVREIREKGMKAYYVLSPKGIWFALTSKFWLYNAYSSDIMFCLSGGATLVNLWHGLPMKRIEFGITSGPLAKRYVSKTLKERFFHPEVFQRPDYLLSGSEFFTTTFAQSFRVSESCCLTIGYPRNAILLDSESGRDGHIEKYEPVSTQSLISELKEKHYGQVLIYLPTWRDSQRDLFAQEFDLKAMDAVLKRRNALLLLKPHANTTVDAGLTTGLTNVRLLPSQMDIYPVLPYTDVLITDYSSVLYDYALMDNKDIVLYLYDYQEYEKERDFTRPFDELAIGKKVFTFDDLLRLIDSMDYHMNPTERAAFITKCWGEDYGHPCERIVDHFLALS